jgi:Putative death-receptor fusion protein (DUF2428)
VLQFVVISCVLTVSLSLAGSWTTMKEVGLLSAELVRCLPIVTDAAASTPIASGQSGGLLTVEQVDSIGVGLVHQLCTVKHSGATEKLHLGFTSLCQHMLQRSEPSLHELPAQWMALIQQHLCLAGQSRSDIVRRSAGTPLAILSLLIAEPSSATKFLLPSAVKQLLALAVPHVGDEQCKEPWPRVHALNCLRAVFESAALAADTSAYFADGAKAAVIGMMADEWEV